MVWFPPHFSRLPKNEKVVEFFDFSLFPKSLGFLALNCKVNYRYGQCIFFASFALEWPQKLVILCPNQNYYGRFVSCLQDKTRPTGNLFPLFLSLSLSRGALTNAKMSGSKCEENETSKKKKEEREKERRRGVEGPTCGHVCRRSGKLPTKKEKKGKVGGWPLESGDSLREIGTSLSLFPFRRRQMHNLANWRDPAKKEEAVFFAACQPRRRSGQQGDKFLVTFSPTFPTTMPKKGDSRNLLARPILFLCVSLHLSPLTAVGVARNVETEAY